MLSFRQEAETKIRACRQVPKLVQGHWEVQTLTLCDGWVNCWHIEQDGVSKLETFASRDAAAKELNQHLADCAFEYATHNLADCPTKEEFQIVFVEG